MNMYNVRFYGCRTKNKIGNEIIVIYDNDSNTKNMPRKITLEDTWTEKFSIIILEEHDGKKDVLKVEYATGRNEYFTLHKPWYTKVENENVWEEIEENEFVTKFTKIYADFVLNNNAQPINCSTHTIFARSFWVVRTFESYTLRTVVNAFAKEIDAREYQLGLKQKNCILEAMVLPEYKGRKFVLKYKEQYFTLFNQLYSYDKETKEWYIHDEPDKDQIKEIREKIKEAYIKDIAEID